MAFSTGSGGGPQSDINVTPLVDVVLVLLIIFMVVTPLLQVEMRADIPKKEEEQPPEPPPPDQDQIVVQIKDNGHIFMNADEVTEEELAARVKPIMDRRKGENKIAFLSGTDNLEFGRVIHIMDLMKGAGVKRVGIIDPI